MKKNILSKYNFLAEVTFKGWNMVLEEKVKTSKIFEFPILSIRNGKLGNLGSVLLLQILAVVVT